MLNRLLDACFHFLYRDSVNYIWARFQDDRRKLFVQENSPDPDATARDYFRSSLRLVALVVALMGYTFLLGLLGQVF